MPISTIDGFVERIADGYYLVEQFQAEYRTAAVALFSGGFGGHAIWRYTVPSMPTGVSAFIPVRLDVQQGTTTGYYVLARQTHLGSLNISTNVFTDDAAMPTLTECGVSRQIWGSLWIEVSVALNATPGSLTVTYVDQDGNSAETSSAMAMTASTPVRSGTGFHQLNTGDIGVMDMTSAARTAGTTPTGTLEFYGLEPIGQVQNAMSIYHGSLDLLGMELNPMRLEAGEKIVLLGIGTGSKAYVGFLTMVGDTP